MAQGWNPYPWPRQPLAPRLEREVEARLSGLAGSPLLREYVRGESRRQQEGSPRFVRTPLQALGERASIACELMVRPDQGFGAPLTPGHIRASLGIQLLTAVPFLWRPDMFKEAIAQPVPTHIVAHDVLPHASMFWTYENGNHLVTSDGRDLTLDATLVLDNPPVGFVFGHVSVSDEATNQITLAFGKVPYAATWPHDFTDAERATIGPVLGMLSFLNSPFIPKDEQRIDARLRRTLEREGMTRDEASTPVHVVDLRAAAPAHRDSPEGGQRPW